MESFLSGRATVAKLKPVAARSTTDGFSPLFEKKAGPTVTLPPDPAPTATAPSHPQIAPAVAMVEAVPHTHKVGVEVVRVDGAVQGIIVTCACGERIELDCMY